MQPWWGCITASGVGDIGQGQIGITNAEKYMILIHYAIPSRNGLIVILKNCKTVPNDPKHTADASEIIFGEKNN